MDYRKVWSDTFGPIIKGFHVHHIIPRCEGGGDNLGNLIALHPDDHALIHEMRGDRKCKGFMLVMKDRDYSGENHPMWGRKHSDETKAKMSKAKLGGEAWNKGKKITHVHWTQRPGADLAIMGGKRKNRDNFARGSDNPTCLPKYEQTCEHCSRTMNKSHITRWHGDNCKFRKGGV